jgi:hypothetical protein
LRFKGDASGRNSVPCGGETDIFHFGIKQLVKKLNFGTLIRRRKRI